MAGSGLHPQVRAWLEEVGLHPDVVGGDLLAAGYGHSPAAFGRLSLPDFHSVLGLHDFHQRRRLHALLLRVNGRVSPLRQPPPPSPSTRGATQQVHGHGHHGHHGPTPPSPHSDASSASSYPPSRRQPSPTTFDAIGPTTSSRQGTPTVSDADSMSHQGSNDEEDSLLDWGDEASSLLSDHPSFSNAGEGLSSVDDIMAITEEDSVNDGLMDEVGVDDDQPLASPISKPSRRTGLKPRSRSFSSSSTTASQSSSPRSSPIVPDPSQATHSSSSSTTPRTQNLRVSVCVRKRPLLDKEQKQRDKDIVLSGKTPNTLEVHEPKVKVDMTKYTEVHSFTFDHYFSDLHDNFKVYEEAVQPLVSTVFKNGARVTCFCYGQTGSGKTHTMMGKRGEDGLYALAAKDIFKILNEEYASRSLNVYVALFEIYGNKLFDLLNERKQIVARQNAKQQVCVIGLKEHRVSDAEDLLSLISKGSASRSTSATGVHAESSRSHAILQISLKNGEEKTRGMFSFIDLAGSEKAGDTTENSRQTRIEGAEINKSLLALKECIRALDRSQKHAPFRQSTLTQVLKDSFMGPHSRTIMIANIAPNSSFAEHTLNTLRYADRVRELRGNNPAFTPGSSPEASAFGKSGASRQRQGPSEDVPSPRRSTSGITLPSGDEDIVKWHRHHLAELTRLVDEELMLLEKVDSGEVTGSKYREALNDILIDEALLFAKMPKLE